ncbi:MATE family efflux transporter, partial [Clostridium botulinum]
ILGNILFAVFPDKLLMLFNASEEMLSLGTVALRVISISYVAASFNFIFPTLFQSVGNGLYSSVISLMRQLIVILPISYILSKSMGLMGVWISFPIAEIISAIISVLLFIRIYKKEPIFKK